MLKELTKDLLVVAKLKHRSPLVVLPQQNVTLLSHQSNLEKHIILSMSGANVQDILVILFKVFLDLFVGSFLHYFPDGDNG